MDNAADTDLAREEEEGSICIVACREKKRKTENPNCKLQILEEELTSDDRDMAKSLVRILGFSQLLDFSPAPGSATVCKEFLDSGGGNLSPAMRIRFRVFVEDASEDRLFELHLLVSPIICCVSIDSQ